MNKIGGLRIGNKRFKVFLWIYFILLLIFSSFMAVEVFKTGFDPAFPGGDWNLVTSWTMVGISVYFLFYWEHSKYFIAWNREKLIIKSKNGKMEFRTEQIVNTNLKLNLLKIELSDGTIKEIDIYHLYLSYDEIHRFRKDFER